MGVYKLVGDGIEFFPFEYVHSLPREDQLPYCLSTIMLRGIQ